MAKIKELLIKYSRKTKELEKVTEIFGTIVLILFIIIVLWNIQVLLFARSLYVLLTKITIILGTIGFCIYILESMLNIIQKNEEKLEKNKLIYIFLSDRNVMWYITLFILTPIAVLMLAVIWKGRILIYILFLLAIFIIPHKISNYFKKKLIE